ncbi:hypothetical protein DL95DRAFT_470049 [Leptodontidium sp. 2 PMI_412]|nr:hypothetical protein DL95DRAFT_470049 [Leptodontidium sp. 2 PMI_412]
MSYGFPNNLPVKESPAMQFLRIISPGILSIAQGLFVLLVSFTPSSDFLAPLLMVDLRNITTSPEIFTVPDVGDPGLWLKIEIHEDAIYEPEDNEATEIVNMTESSDIPTSPEFMSPEQAPLTGDAFRDRDSEPTTDSNYQNT